MKVGLYTVNDIKKMIFDKCHKIGDHYVSVYSPRWLFKIVEIDGNSVNLLAHFAWDRPIDPNNPHFGITYCSFDELNGKYFIKVIK